MQLLWQHERRNVLRVVLDTNIIVSGMATKGTMPSQVLEAWRAGKFVLVTSPSIMQEVQEVLSRPKITSYLHLTSSTIRSLLYTFSTRAFVTQGILAVHVVENDPDDNKFIACALEGSATHIVTGDNDLLRLQEYDGVHIVKARAFMNDLT